MAGSGLAAGVAISEAFLTMTGFPTPPSGSGDHCLAAFCSISFPFFSAGHLLPATVGGSCFSKVHHRSGMFPSPCGQLPCAPHLCPCLVPPQLTSTRSTTCCSPATPSTPCSCTSRPSRRPTGSSTVGTAKSKSCGSPCSRGPCPRAAGDGNSIRGVTCHCPNGHEWPLTLLTLQLL